MRHQVKGRKLGRSTPHRKATLQALAVALIKEQRIQTTLPKAKELRTFVEPIITKAKEDTTHNRRQVFSKLRDKYAVTELFDNIIPEVGDRPGGYTRVLKLGRRLGDSAQMAVIELVDFNDVKPESADKKKKRTRRAGKSNKPTESTEETSKEVKAEEKKEEAPKAKKEEKPADPKASAESKKEEKADSSSEEK
jgi:large subunit ribosomal protein L17